MAVYAWSQSLLLAHLEVISLCWNEYLAKAPIADRVRLVSFLVQLHPHFPTWKRTLKYRIHVQDGSNEFIQFFLGMQLSSLSWRTIISKSTEKTMMVRPQLIWYVSLSFEVRLN